ncbi:hypothetical protein, partial [Pseudomonas fluorescens]|uniref:hypothetical protein n=1 Tax=Pseudomonas fluorescens TaxID=294 RepID=UPI001C54AEF5
RRVSQQVSCLTRRFREQARSHRIFPDYGRAAQHATDSPETIKTISGRGRTPQAALQSDPYK